MVEWNQLDVASFLEQATGFLAEHGQLDGPSCHAPPAKRARSVGLSSDVSPLILILFLLLRSLSLLFVTQTVSQDIPVTTHKGLSVVEHQGIVVIIMLD